MKSNLVAIVAAEVLPGCGESQDIWEDTQAGNIEAVKEHLAAGEDVNAKDDNGRAPLDMGIEYNHTETTDLLRKHGGKTGEELKAEGK